MKRYYKELLVWQKSMQVVKEVYRVTASFPSEEKFGLASQMRRAAVSIPSNIAEGQGRPTPGEFRQFLGHARGSLHELETQNEIARDLGFVAAERAASLDEALAEVGRLLNGLLRSVK